MDNISQYIKGLPKAELHLHIEGTFEPELMFKIAGKNQIKLKYGSVEEIRKAYQFNNLQDFLDIYYAAASVLRTEQDFYDLTWAYLVRANADHILHTEIFFDPQTHLANGIQFKTVIGGIVSALQDGFVRLGITSYLIMCFLRHLDESDALALLEEAKPYREHITAIGLDSSERGNPPEKFKNAFAKALEYGYLTVAHAGEEGSAQNIRSAIEILKVARIDHGNSCLTDETVVDLLKEKKIPLTLCPLSNLKLKVIGRLEDHPIFLMIEKGLTVTINSDDPAYFGGYVNENYIAVSKALNLNQEQIYQIARNSFVSSFLPVDIQNKYLDLLYQYNKSQQ
ncbi:MAG: adenosine deaminase [Mariniphaga sp.]